jgi:poly(3-hydroxybutyrate) depolymerase
MADATPATDVLSPAPYWRESGCGRPPPYTGRGRLPETAFADEESITYIPSGYERGHPHKVLLAIHQTAEPPATLLDVSGLEDLAERENLVLLVPHGPENVLTVWNRSSTHVSRLQSEVEQAHAQLCLDSTQLYVLSIGSSGYLALALAERPWVTAVATHSFRAQPVDFESSDPTRIAPILTFSGLKDQLYPAEGGRACAKKPGVFLGLKQPLSWQEEDLRGWSGCSGARVVYRRERHGTCFTWRCDTAFVSCHLDGGHPWAGAGPRSGFQGACDGAGADFPTTETMWKFFEEAPALPPAFGGLE